MKIRQGKRRRRRSSNDDASGHDDQRGKAILTTPSLLPSEAPAGMGSSTVFTRVLQLQKLKGLHRHVTTKEGSSLAKGRRNASAQSGTKITGTEPESSV